MNQSTNMIHSIVVLLEVLHTYLNCWPGNLFCNDSVVSVKYLSGRDTNTTFNPCNAIVSEILFPIYIYM